MITAREPPASQRVTVVCVVSQGPETSAQAPSTSAAAATR